MSDEDVIAYVDGELGPIEALRFERAMEGDAALADAVARHRRLRETVSAHFAPVADEAPPERLTAPLADWRRVIAFPGRRAGSAARYAALAATLVAGFVLGQSLSLGPPAPIGQRGDMVMAQGMLARALDGQLAATQDKDAAYAIGVSFRAADGRYCRTFAGAAGAGLGCRRGDGWRLERFAAKAPDGPSGDYRQAASPAASILADAQEMMAGAPLDAVQERAARAQGWRN